MEDALRSQAAFNELIADAKRAMQRIDESKVRHAAAKRQLLQQVAGPHFDELMASRESAERHLDDADSKKRLAALMVLLDHWRPNTQLAQTCENLAFADGDATVRGVALSGLSQCYADTQDARVLRLLASIVANEQQSNRFRKSAYFGLFPVVGIAGIDARSLPDPDFRFPDDVDWELVSRLAPNAELAKRS
jgi:hypothetical protein